MAKCILHLEDNEDHARLIDSYLRSEGYDVIEARTTLEARQILTAAAANGTPQIDGLLADLKMKDPVGPLPDIESTEVGVWFLYWIRQRLEYAQLPIAVLSAHTEDTRMPGWKHLLRIREVVLKPATSRLLGPAILNTFGRP
jgi:CheY-like chemotaxis protein